MEIEDLLPALLVEEFLRLYPNAQEAAYERAGVKKVVIDGKPREIEGKRCDFKLIRSRPQYRGRYRPPG